MSAELGRVYGDTADSRAADRAPAGDQGDTATPLAGEAVDAFTARLVRDYRAALDNLTAVQARCTEQELEIRVLRRALRMAVETVACEVNGDVETDEAWLLELARKAVAR